jgi:hypothetical protein
MTMQNFKTRTYHEKVINNVLENFGMLAKRMKI